MIEVEDLTVRFGGVTPIDGMTVSFAEGACGLIGPNGAGKTTFFNVLSGFVKPVSGSVRAFGEDLLAMTFVALDVDPARKVETLSAGERRLVEVARAVVGSPRVVLLDEPAAGLPNEETEHLGAVIRRIPEQFGALVILVDHDMSLVSSCCESTAVLDFGKLIAAGTTAEVLRDENVIRAYLGTEEL
jgi:ABC-type branched-subunit amino acid transport system ATPase component